MSQTVKDVLDVCERFVGVVERWGGDVLPGLLEVEIEMDGEGEGVLGREVERRGEVVREIRDVSSISFFRFDVASSKPKLTFLSRLIPLYPSSLSNRISKPSFLSSLHLPLLLPPTLLTLPPPPTPTPTPPSQHSPSETPTRPSLDLVNPPTATPAVARLAGQ